MVDVEWIVFPVEDGLELVIDSTDGLVLAQAKAAVAASHPGYVVAQEWVMETGDVILLVPVPIPVEASEVTPDAPQPAASPRPALIPAQRERSVAEETARAAHPAGKGRTQR